MIRVLIADNHPILRRGIREILEEAGDISVVGEAGNHRQLLSAVREYQFDVLLLGILMLEEKDLNILDELYRLTPEIKVLILTIHPVGRFASRALQSRVYGYLTRESAPEELIAAIRMAAQDEKHTTPALAFEQGRDKKAAHATLSEREFQILHMLAAGKSPTEIGKELELSVKTISTYRARIMAKLQLKNTAEIIRYAIRHGLIE